MQLSYPELTSILNFRQRLSFRLGFLIVLIITVAFSLLFGFLFHQCKLYIQRAAFDHATQLLDNTVEHINGIMAETELVTNYMATTIPRHLHPDSLLVFTRRALVDNPFLTGMAISMEPNFLTPRQSWWDVQASISFTQTQQNCFVKRYSEMPLLRHSAILTRWVRRCWKVIVA